MCGIFGTIRPRRYPLRRAAVDALLDLGGAAEERGKDSAGLALFDGRGRTAASICTSKRPLVDFVNGRWRLVLSQARFGDDLPAWPHIRADLASATIVLGHTRWATQGARSLRNASPIRVGPIVGTHNGDVSVPAGFPTDRTDTEYLYRRLGAATSGPQTLAVLRGVRGRAALAWARIDEPGYVHLARTALSPIWIAADSSGAVWWASNPQWLRTIDEAYRLGLAAPRPLHEGTYLRLRSERTSVTADQPRTFVATCRPRDEQIAAYAAWRGFTPQDLLTEQLHLHHQVAGASTPRSAGSVQRFRPAGAGGIDPRWDIRAAS